MPSITLSLLAVISALASISACTPQTIQHQCPTLPYVPFVTSPGVSFDYKVDPNLVLLAVLYASGGQRYECRRNPLTGHVEPHHESSFADLYDLGARFMESKPGLIGIPADADSLMATDLKNWRNIGTHYTYYDGLIRTTDLHEFRAKDDAAAGADAATTPTTIWGRTWADLEMLQQLDSRASSSSATPPGLVLTNIETDGPIRAAYCVHLRGGTDPICDGVDLPVTIPYSAQWYMYGIPGAKLFNSDALAKVCNVAAKPRPLTPEAWNPGSLLGKVRETAGHLVNKLLWFKPSPSTRGRGG